jgi:hypothetical protein
MQKKSINLASICEINGVLTLFDFCRVRMVWIESTEGYCPLARDLFAG